MRNIIVVDCISSGVNYIADIRNRGYKPIVLELKPYENEDEYRNLVNGCYSNTKEKFDMIFEKDSYEETLKEVEKLNPKIVIPGSERGVILATKLANDLNLLCNPIENIDAMTLKDKMQEKIAQAGLRYIRGKAVKNLQEALEYYDSEGLKEVVVKPVYSAGSTGVHICLNRNEFIEGVKKIFSEINLYGDAITEIVVQDFIRGEEYYVNTASCDGIHQVSLIWKYSKTETPDGMLYDTIETVNRLSLGEAEMVEYAYKVADALGIKYGPVHGEYIIDDDGPVLIEVNCRPSGCSMNAEYLDRIAGHHETDLFLDGYLKPTRFHERRKRKYRLIAYGALKIFTVPRDIIAKSTPMNNISPRLKSFYKSNIVNIEDEDIFYPKTRNLETSCGYIYLVNENLGELRNDIEFLRRIERNAFSLVLSEDNSNEIEIDEEKIIADMKNVINITDKYGTGLLITDQFIDDVDIVQIGLKDINDVNGEFDFVIVNLNKSLINQKDIISVEIILKILSDVRVGGIVFVPESTYNCLPSKRKGMEALMTTLNLRIEVPPHGINAGVIASRESY